MWWNEFTCLSSPSLNFKTSPVDLWHPCWYLGVSLNVCVCEAVCVQSIPVSNTKHSSALCSPSPKQTAPSGPKMRTRLSIVASGPKKPPQTFWGRISDLVSQMILYIHSCTCQTQNTLIFTTGFSSQWSVFQAPKSGYSCIISRGCNRTESIWETYIDDNKVCSLQRVNWDLR